MTNGASIIYSLLPLAVIVIAVCLAYREFGVRRFLGRHSVIDDR